MPRAAWLLALLALAAAPLGAQISPGPLARAHQSLEGPTKCGSCHGPSAEAMPRLCQNCHREVGWLVSARRGLHANPRAMAGRTCGSCHPDHAGREFDLIAWPSGSPERLDHREAGWPLEGGHREAACADCHTAAFRTGPAAVLSPRKTGGAGWTGLETTCVSCHRQDDPHANALGTDCARCHEVGDWSPAPGFDHGDSRYPLTGAHREVDCDQCHRASSLGIAPGPDGTRAARYRPLRFADCADCHADPHRGRLQGECSSCHVTRGFDVLDTRGFNHASTRFPLLGKHRSTGCEACHGRAMATPRPAFGRCATCHADVHGETTARGDSTSDCAACHREQGFRPATYTVAQHANTGFPLGGKHETVRCAACHVAGASPTTGDTIVPLRLAVAGCVTCHADPHAGQVADRRCDACHADAGWSAIRPDSAAHAATALPLDGAHATISCARCHGPERPGLPALPSGASVVGTGGVVFRIPEVRCAACHGDPHPATTTAADCAACHGSASFRPAQLGVAEHATYGFALDGGHRAVPCVECHTGLAAPATATGAGWSLVGATSRPRIDLHAVRGTTCAACHDSPHGGQFAARPDGGACDACHVSATFAGTLRFDHDRGSAFPLAGAHASVACDRCHRTESTPDGPRTVYRPVPHRCEDCHATSSGGTR